MRHYMLMSRYSYVPLSVWKLERWCIMVLRLNESSCFLNMKVTTEDSIPTFELTGGMRQWRQHDIGSAVFVQMTAECPYNGMPLSPLIVAPFHGGSGPPSNKWFLGPIRVHNPSIGFIRCCSDDRNVSLYFTMVRFFSSELPFPMGDLNPRLIHGSLGPPEFSPQVASRSVEPFLHGSVAH